ncbi:MAG: response regulator [Methanobacterium sp. ERen5]|nr:MAG: response regulator [Methanobacterium sp. ERen5]
MGPNILVVEDERITAEDIKSGLECSGYNVIDMVASGKEAIESAGKFQPDLVLMDIKLKGKMDGIEAAGQIKLKYDIPVIYLTAYSDECTLTRAKASEHSGFFMKDETGLIKKPFEESELHSAIDTTLYRHKMEKNHDHLVSAMLKHYNEAVIATNSDGLVKLMNSLAESLTGCKLDNVVGKKVSTVFEPLKTFESFDLIQMKEHLQQNEHVLVSNGQEIKVKCDLNSITDDDGQINGFILIFKQKNH